MSIIIFGDDFSFPEGDAVTNRVHTYAKGYYENGFSVHVICFASDYNTVLDGIFNGIYFYHPFGQSKRNRFFIIRRFQKFIKYFKTISLIKKINKDDKIVFINCWTTLFSTQFFAFILSKCFKTKIITERSEHPLRLYQNSLLRKIQGNIKVYFETKLCDGIFCISSYLIEFYKAKGVGAGKLLLVPSTVDPDRFAQGGEKPVPFRYLGYFGGLTFDRDNIDILIKAFAKISNKYPEINLVIGGNCSQKEKQQIEDLIADLKIQLRVILLKFLPRKEITRYIVHSDILIMVRSNDWKTKASFPSKLTEYLSTSKPVVTVNVGEISKYLTDGLNSFLVEPGNCDELADKLDYVLYNYEEALKIGQRGKELTNTIFNYYFQAKRMIDFIYTL